MAVNNDARSAARAIPKRVTTEVWISRLISDGTGLAIPGRHTDGPCSDPLSDFEARQLSSSRGSPAISRLESTHDCDVVLLHFALLRLTDLSLVDYRTKWTLRDEGSFPDNESARQAFWRVHKERPRNEGAQRQAPAGNPSQTEALQVLSATAYYLHVETASPRLPALVDLVDAVYPPIFILSKRQRHAVEQAEREDDQRSRWRRLSEDIHKIRKHTGGGEHHYLELARALDATEPPPWTRLRL